MLLSGFMVHYSQQHTPWLALQEPSGKLQRVWSVLSRAAGLDSGLSTCNNGDGQNTHTRESCAALTFCSCLQGQHPAFFLTHATLGKASTHRSPNFTPSPFQPNCPNCHVQCPNYHILLTSFFSISLTGWLTGGLRWSVSIRL